MNSSYSKKKYHPVKKYYPKKKNTRRKNSNSFNINTSGFLGNNLANNMRFGTKGDTVSGYVKREVVVKDSKGNTQIAREMQFFNSGKGYKIEVNGYTEWYLA